jgi:hypothetical protein
VAPTNDHFSHPTEIVVNRRHAEARKGKPPSGFNEAFRQQDYIDLQRHHQDFQIGA